MDTHTKLSKIRLHSRIDYLEDGGYADITEIRYLLVVIDRLNAGEKLADIENE